VPTTHRPRLHVTAARRPPTACGLRTRTTSAAASMEVQQVIDQPVRVGPLAKNRAAPSSTTGSTARTKAHLFWCSMALIPRSPWWPLRATAVRRSICQAPPRVVVLDVAIPALDGVQTLPQLRRNSPQSSIVFSTMHRDEHCELLAVTHSPRASRSSLSRVKRAASASLGACRRGKPRVDVRARAAEKTI
jgi:CheY-like chemotaxis protein